MSGWPKQGWRESLAVFGHQLAAQTGETVDGWRHRARTLVERWKRLHGGERWNVALYVLTGVSMLALTVEFLAGPDSLPTEVTSAPAPIGSSGLTPVIPSSTTTLTLPPVTQPPAAAVQGPATTAPPAASPATQAIPQPTPPPTDPPPTDPPPTDPPQTAPPTTKAPATTISTGFTVVPPVPPSFP